MTAFRRTLRWLFGAIGGVFFLVVADTIRSGYERFYAAIELSTSDVALGPEESLTPLLYVVRTFRVPRP